MTVDFLHNQIIRDTISERFIESFNENLLPSLCLRYGDSLECVQFYEDNLTRGLRIGGVFHYPLTVVVSGAAKTEWISWQVANYRHYNAFNPFTYKGKELLEFKILDSVPSEVSSKIEGLPIYCASTGVPIILSAASDDKTFLSGKYSQSFVDLLASEITDRIEHELAISGLSGSGIVLEMCFMPSTFMEHKVKSTTYRRLKIKARGCAARDLWVKWTRLDGKGTYTVSDVVDRSQIRFELAEDVSGSIKEREYRYLTGESVEKYQLAMGRKNITEWREMMRRVVKRGEVEKTELIKIKKPVFEAAEEYEPKEEAVTVEAPKVSAVTIPSSVEREKDELTERLNALLGNTAPAPTEPKDEVEAVNNSDLDALLRGALGAAAPARAEVSESIDEPPFDLSDSALSEKIGEIAQAEETQEIEEIAQIETSQEIEEIEEKTVEYAPVQQKREENIRKTEETSAAELEIEARVRREIEEKMRAEMDELRRKNEEAELLRKKLDEQKRAEMRERERLAEAARLAVLDKEKREADRRAEEERDRLNAERKAAEEKARLEERRAAEEREAERLRIEAELQEKEPMQEVAESEPKIKYVTKNVSLIFRRGGVDSSMTRRVREIIVATIKYLHKENVYVRIKATVVDSTTLNLTFSELPESEQQLVVDIIQVLGKSNIGVTKAILE